MLIENINSENTSCGHNSSSNQQHKPSMIAYNFNPSNREEEAGKLQV
jgi:hypothetical protein